MSNRLDVLLEREFGLTRAAIAGNNSSRVSGFPQDFSSHPMGTRGTHKKGVALRTYRLAYGPAINVGVGAWGEVSDEVCSAV